MGHVHRHGIQLCLIQEWLQQCTENSHKGNKLKTRCGRWKSPIISSVSLGYPALSYRIWPMQIEYWNTKSKGKYGWDISTDDHGQEGKIVRGLERKKRDSWRENGHTICKQGTLDWPQCSGEDGKFEEKWISIDLGSPLSVLHVWRRPRRVQKRGKCTRGGSIKMSCIAKCIMERDPERCQKGNR